MSCFIVSTYHLNALATWAHSRKLPCAKSPAVLAHELFGANCAAYAERYPDAQAEVDALSHSFRGFDIWRAASIAGLPTVAILKACDCLAYQCADLSDWEGSRAEGALSEICAAALAELGGGGKLGAGDRDRRQLPGYDAAPWELTGPVAAQLFDPETVEGLSVMRARNAYRDAAAELVDSLRECVAALELAGAAGEPGDMPIPELDRARQLLARVAPEVTQ